jgi:hypothetical protein
LSYCAAFEGKIESAGGSDRNAQSENANRSGIRTVAGSQFLGCPLQIAANEIGALRFVI